MLAAAAPPGRIQRLPPLLVNQIAAGEVVERPASVVKELLDNALDAGATRVAVELEAGGVELVQVTDDGTGIGAEELPLALAAHATSKIASAADLDRIATLGFRGEALASIVSVARVSLLSRPRDQPHAGLIEAEGDALGAVVPAAGPPGTRVRVRNLFFNTPARRKFLRTLATEQGHCLETASALALSHPGVGFVLRCDGRAVLDLPPGQSPRERALAVLGPELAPELLEVGADEFDDSRGVALWGLAGTPALARSTSRCQHVFLNGRPIRDRTLQHALREAYRGLIDPARYPTAVLLLEMDPAMVDVNVHPQKTEVRFRDSSLVHSVVLRAVRDALRRADLTPLAGTALAGRPAGDLPGSGIDPLPARGAPPGHVEAEALASFFRGLTPGRARLQDLEPPGAATEAARHDGAPGVSPATSLPAAGPDGTDGARGPTVAAVPGQGELGGPPTPTGRLLQVHNSYVVTQDEQGIVIVDQHALHERAMFEYLLARVSRGPLESQPLLVPVVIPATPAQAARLAELAPLLGRLGIAVEPVGPAAVAVQAFPTLLTERGVEPESLVSGLIERAEADGLAPGTEAALHEVLDMMACKAAIKAGAHLSERELSALLELRQSVERSSNCPHGRPTSIRLTLRELDKRFGRS